MIVIILILLTLFLSSCSLSCDYLPAIYAFPPSIRSPLGIDGNTLFLGANASGGKSFYEEDEINQGEGSLVIATGEEWFRFASGGFMYFGRYNFNNSCDKIGWQPYFGFGIDFDMCIFTPTKLLNLGIGLQAGFSAETGSYIEKAFDTGLLFFVPLFSQYLAFQYNISNNKKLFTRLGFGLPGLAYVDIGYYDLKFGGFWMGASLQSVSLGFSAKLK
ncbi:MAG: hypothetical protein ABIL37_06375 [candidate division WOR-3 bacterium]